VAGGVDNINAMLFKRAIHTTPETGGSRRGNGYAALLFLLHPIHGGRAVVHLTYFVRNAGVIENAFGGRRFASVDVSHDADVSIQR